ncbi:MAG TPA: hypothetical protein PKD31_17120, partial [Blastocatellia bacterium]|nr:hypothetical protein [Blastocatellia bacterium]
MSNVIITLFSAADYDRAAQGVAGAGRRLADQLGGKLHAVVIGAHDPMLNMKLAAVADAVVSADQAELKDYQPEVCLAALTELCKQIGAGVVLLGNDTYSQELAPRLAYRLGGSAVGDG